MAYEEDAKKIIDMVWDNLIGMKTKQELIELVKGKISKYLDDLVANEIQEHTANRSEPRPMFDKNDRD